MQHITKVNVILASLLLITLISLTISLIAYQTIKSDLKESEDIVAIYQKQEQLEKRSEQFLYDLAQGDIQEYLSNSQLEKINAEDAHDNHGQSVEVTDEDVEIEQLYTQHNEEQKNATSYAVIQIAYDTNPVGSNSDDRYHQRLNVTSTWKEEEEEWKIDDLDVSLLEDSNDIILREEAQQQLEEAQGGNGSNE